jgi:Ca2+:H+ antiporter
VITREWPLLPIYATGAAFLLSGDALGPASLPWTGFIIAWLFAAMLAAAFAVVRHSECLAAIFGEPFGTLILTIAITAIEVMLISAVMLHGPEVSTLARDTMFAVIMIVFNGMVGVSLLVGGLRYHEQLYNLQGANAFLAVILPLAVLGLVVPNFTSSPEQTLSLLHQGFLAVVSVALYGVFLTALTLRHRHYFIEPDTALESFDRAQLDLRPAAYHGVLLILYIIPVVVLSKKIAVPIDNVIDTLGAPAALVGFLTAALVLSPESLGAVRAALANQLQRSINLLLGSVLASISLTIPAVLAIGILSERTVVLGLDAIDAALLILTLGVSMLTLASGRTNVVLGAVHLVLFFAYIVLIFER